MAPAPRPPPRVAAQDGSGSRGPGFPFRGAAEMHRPATRAATPRGWRSVPADASSGTECAAAARMGGASARQFRDRRRFRRLIFAAWRFRDFDPSSSRSGPVQRSARVRNRALCASKDALLRSPTPRSRYARTADCALGAWRTGPPAPRRSFERAVVNARGRPYTRRRGGCRVAPLPLASPPRTAPTRPQAAERMSGPGGASTRHRGGPELAAGAN